MKRPSALTLAIALTVLPIVPLAATAADPPSIDPARMTGFRDADAQAERERESHAAAAIRPDTLRRHLRMLTEEPHVAGTPADFATAEYVRQRLAAYGWDARIEAVPVYLNWPAEMRLEVLEPQVRRLSVREAGVEWDKDAWSGGAFDAFHGYSASGDVTGGVVYANYGDVGDFAKLAELGVDVRGKIALVRYGKIFRGLKVRNAQNVGAAGVIIYSDPADDGFTQNDPYPRGPGRPPDGIQRGSVQFLSEGPGDPTTPGWASTPGGKRLKPSEVAGIPRIPSIPLAWSEAEKIFEALEGPLAPAGWQGAIPLTYHVGPGPSVVHLVSRQDYAVRPIWNVIATLKGRENPEQKVICGNHRDAWTFGALDPNSGTICMLEMARTLGALASSGWRPRRSIVLCSWDGEEYGLLGSTEWCEANATDLGTNAVAYLNIDTAVSGKQFRASGCHALRDVLAETMRDVPDASRRGSVWQIAYDRAWSEGMAEWSRRNRERRWRNEQPRPFAWDVGSLGSGSDYTAFVDHLGVPSLDVRFEGLHGNYHSMYDDFDFMDRVVDPGFAYHATATELWSRLALRLAEAEVVPLRYSNTGTFVIDELQSVEERAEDAAVGKPDSLRFTATVSGARTAAAKLRNAAIGLERRADAALEGTQPWPSGGANAINASLLAAERALLGPGLPGRTWFRHEVYAPGLNTGYAAVPLPRVGQAILDKDPKAYARGFTPLVEALERAAAALGAVK